MAALSDVRWQELAHDLSARVAVYAPDWAEPSGNDPGITIVELFGFLAESLRSRADLSPRARSRLREVIEQQGGATCYVTLGLVERPADPAPEGEHSRIDESAEVTVSDDIPPGHLEIARLLHDGGGWRVDASFKAPPGG